MTISIIVIPSVIHQGNDTRVPNVTFIPFCEQRQAQERAPPASSPPTKRIDYTPMLFAAACEWKSNALFDKK